LKYFFQIYITCTNAKARTVENTFKYCFFAEICVKEKYKVYPTPTIVSIKHNQKVKQAKV